MWLGLEFMLVPGMQVCKLVNGGYQERIGIQIEIYGDAVAFTVERRAVIAKFAVTVTRDLKLALKIIYPPADQGSGIRWQVLL